MKKKLFSILLVAFALLANAQQTTLKVVNKNLTLTTGQNVVLRGINYPILDQGDISLSNTVAVHNYIDQVALTGANCIRIPWYTNGQSWRDQPANGGATGTVNGYVQNGHLNNLIAYCISKGMIPFPLSYNCARMAFTSSSDPTLISVNKYSMRFPATRLKS